jgi:processive 1,2-diacylglycerol beta-glucosyltransferase
VILSATAGYGHFKAGRDLAARLAALNLGVEVHHLNIFDYSGTSVRVLMERTWSVASVSPGLRTFYSSLHRAAIASERFSNLFRNLHVFAASKLEREFDDHEVLAVIALHPSAAAAASLWKRMRNFKFYSVATDLVVHAMQCYKEIDQIFADRRAVIVSKAAINAKRESRMVLAGLPVSSQHYEFVEGERTSAKQVLVSFGAFGMRARNHIEKIVRLAGLFPVIEFHFVCGNNSKLLEEVESRVADEDLVGRVVVHGFVENMAELMQRSFLLIGKPVGIT